MLYTPLNEGRNGSDKMSSVRVKLQINFILLKIIQLLTGKSSSQCIFFAKQYPLNVS